MQLARAVRGGRWSAQDVASAHADAIEARDGELQAFVAFDRGELLESARAVDRGDRRGPLAGVPVAIKDIIDTAQYPTAYGSPIYHGHRPALDAACVLLLRQAGAVVLGKTVTAEFATFAPGPTRNPHAPAHTPGGSSSGSAAAVAAGLATLALGTQTAGSVIRPASFCGVVGYKPSAGRIARSGVKIISDRLDEVGLFARTLDDAALLASVLAQQPGWADSPSQGRLAPPPRVGWLLSSRADCAAPAMRQAVMRAAQCAFAAGAPQADIAWPGTFDALFDAQRTIQLAETARALAAEYAYRRAQLSAQLAEAIREAHAYPAQRYADALKAGLDCADALPTLFADADVLLAPSATGEAPHGLGSTGDPLFCRPWQLLGCPMISLPFGRGPLGLPLGVSVLARPGQDARLFAAAAWLQACWSAREDGAAYLPKGGIGIEPGNT